jgi:hypothetical protein
VAQRKLFVISSVWCSGLEPPDVAVDTVEDPEYCGSTGWEVCDGGVFKILGGTFIGTGGVVAAVTECTFRFCSLRISVLKESKNFSNRESEGAAEASNLKDGRMFSELLTRSRSPAIVSISTKSTSDENMPYGVALPLEALAQEN